MQKKQLKGVLEKHKMWLAGEEGGERADLTGAVLRRADLRGAVLRGADLRDADLRRAVLRGADLTGAGLRDADLTGADLRDADLRRADLDFSCWPLWCGTKGVIVDKRIAAQLAAHFCVIVCDDEGVKAAQKALLPLARQSHRAGDLGLL